MDIHLHFSFNKWLNVHLLIFFIRSDTVRNYSRNNQPNLLFCQWKCCFYFIKKTNDIIRKRKFILQPLLQVLWPNGIFFIQLRNAQIEDDSQSTTSRTDGGKSPKPGSFELQLEAARRASDVKKMLFGEYCFISI